MNRNMPECIGLSARTLTVNIIAGIKPLYLMIEEDHLEEGVMLQTQPFHFVT
jgi:hypothetical protein